MTMDAITSLIRRDAGADFAFILTRKGRLLTRDAPPQMPEVGRVACVNASREAAEAGIRLSERTMPREHLVPYGGAAPVDVFVAPCGEAIVCVVLATWADASQVGPALDTHLPTLEELLASAKAARAGRRGKTMAPPPPPPAAEAAPAPPPARPASKPGRAERAAPTSRGRAKRPSELPPGGGRKPPTVRPPSRSPSARPPSVRPRALAGLVELSKAGIRANEQLSSSPTIRERESATPPVRGPASSEVPLGGRGSLPMIELGEQPLGRESLAAIEADGRARGSLPDIEISEAPLGRESLAAIEADGEARGFVPRLDVSEVPPGRGARAERSGEARRVRSRTPTEIEVGSAMLGRASVEAIELDDLADIPAGSPHTSAPELEVRADDDGVGSLPPPDPLERTTQPWTESPEDAVRAARAAKLGRALAPPAVDARPMRPSELHGELVEEDPEGAGPEPGAPPDAAKGMKLRPPGAPPRPGPPPLPRAGPTDGGRKRRQNSNVDLFRQALGDLIEGAEATGAEAGPGGDGAAEGEGE